MVVTGSLSIWQKGFGNFKTGANALIGYFSRTCSESSKPVEIRNTNHSTEKSPEILEKKSGRNL